MRTMPQILRSYNSKQMQCRLEETDSQAEAVENAYKAAGLTEKTGTANIKLSLKRGSDVEIRKKGE